jgi:hypothetical protein
MPVPVEFLRGVLGVIGLGCAYMAGRSAVAVRRGWQKLSKLYGWIIRMVLCLAAVAFRHSVDTVDIAVWALAAVVVGIGFWSASHQKPHEDLTHEIFPE